MSPITTPDFTADRIAQMDLEECIDTAWMLGSFIAVRAALLHTHYDSRMILEGFVYPDANEKIVVLGALLERIREAMAEDGATAEDLQEARDVLDHYSDRLFYWDDDAVLDVCRAYLAEPIGWWHEGPGAVRIS